MHRIAVIGANGQVGSEICLLLNMLARVEVIPIVRSAYAAVFLERFGLKCRIGTISNAAMARELLRDADLVVDFSLPRGLPSVARNAIQANLDGVLSSAPEGTPYAFVSSTMAFGMPQNARRYAHNIFARTQYAAQKRYGERLARDSGSIRGRKVYVLRLGQVHGDLQAVSHKLLGSVREETTFALPEAGRVACDAVWVGTIASALTRIAEGTVPPGTYSLVESPDWTLADLYHHYANSIGTSISIVDSREADGPGRGSFAKWFALKCMRVITDHREFLVAQFLPRNRNLEITMKYRHLLRSARSDIADLERAGIPRPLHCVGPIPGRRIEALGNTRHALVKEVIEIRELLHRHLGARGHVFPVGKSDLSP